MFWGLTNVALASIKYDDSPNEAGKKKNFALAMITNIRFLFFFGLNQIGSLLNTVCIGYVNLGIGSLVANGTALLVSYLTEAWLGKIKMTKCKQK